MAEAQPDLILSDYQHRLLVALYCEYNTSACVQEMLQTPELESLYQEFIQLTRSTFSRVEVGRQLEELVRANELGAVSKCLKCFKLRCNAQSHLRHHLCPRCSDMVRGAARSYLPPIVKSGSHGGGVQVSWHPRREDEPSPWQENAIRNLEEGSV